MKYLFPYMEAKEVFAILALQLTLPKSAEPAKLSSNMLNTILNEEIKYCETHTSRKKKYEVRVVDVLDHFVLTPGGWYTSDEYRLIEDVPYDGSTNSCDPEVIFQLRVAVRGPPELDACEVAYGCSFYLRELLSTRDFHWYDGGFSGSDDLKAMVWRAQIFPDRPPSRRDLPAGSQSKKHRRDGEDP
ncbi:MAG: hypothetical protein ACYCOU_07510 [Sulfobacillus sp.]